MQILQIVFATLFVYSFISTIVYIISGENTDVIRAFGLGIFGLILLGILKIIKKIRDYFKYNVGKRAIYEDIETGKKYKCSPKHCNNMHWIQDYKLLKRYAVKGEWKDIPDLPDAIIKKSKRNCDNCKHDRNCDCNYPYDHIKCRHDGYGRVVNFEHFEPK